MKGQESQTCTIMNYECMITVFTIGNERDGIHSDEYDLTVSDHHR